MSLKNNSIHQGTPFEFHILYVLIVNFCIQIFSNDRKYNFGVFVEILIVENVVLESDFGCVLFDLFS